MISLLSRLFIKNRKNVADPAVRQSYGALCGAVGIFLNLLLFCAKFLAGTLSGSIAITADAMNNLSDAGSSVITLLGFKLSARKMDAEHPFGHGRMEYVSGLVVALAIIMMGFELARTSVMKIITPDEVTFSAVSAAILAGSIAVKMYMALYNRRVGGMINSVAMRAASADSLSDMCATTAVLLSLLVARFTGINIDGWAGTAVALMILWTGVKTLRDTVNPLLGSTPDPELIRRIVEIVKEYPEISGIHDLMVHDYGPGRLIVSFHAEVPADGDIVHMHDVVDTVEMRLKRELNCQAVIHMDPIATNDARVNEMRDAVGQAIQQKLDKGASIHDFRMVEGPTHTNLVFDAMVPTRVPGSDEEIRARISSIVRDLPGNCYAVITLDRSDVL